MISNEHLANHAAARTFCQNCIRLHSIEGKLFSINSYWIYSAADTSAIAKLKMSRSHTETRREING